ncbi:O-antigen ligase family protein [Candidatus Kaiserbacteria bacterium]|nr:MAG: O-antigen ligase family protein [Candidatus Kaiserbacteria bacterium]
MNLEKVLRGIVLAGVFSLPLIVFIVSGSTFFPYIVGKNIAFRSIIEIMFGAWILLALLNAAYRPRWTALLLSILAFVAVVAVADLFGENPFKSIWSNFERMDGLVTLIHALMYVIAAGAVMNTQNLWLWLWRASLVVSTFVSMHAIGQLLLTEKGRLDSTLGNPIYLAVYVLFHIFIALVLLARRNSERTEQILTAITLPLLFTVLFFTATRGATLGVIGGLLLAVIGISLSLKGNRKVRLGAALLTVVMVLGVGSFWIAKDTAFVQDSPVLKRFATLSLSEGTVYARTLIWGVAWEGVKERPLLGWGQENFNFVFNKYYDPRMYGQEPWFDRTHNVVFDWLIAAGILGLLTYISIFLTTVWTLYRTEAFTIIQKWLLLGLLAAYGIHNLTVFDNVISYLLFFTVLAWIYGSAHDVWTFRKNKEQTTLILSEKIGVLVGAPLLVLAIGISIWFINIQPWRTSTTLLDALSAIHVAQLQANQDQENGIESAVSNVDRALELFEKAYAFDTYGSQEVAEQWSEAARKVAAATWVSTEQKNEWYNASINSLTHQQERVPNDARYPFFIGSTHYSFGDFAKATENFKRALELSPDRQRILALLVASTANSGDLESALTYAKTSFEAEKEYQSARILYANVLIRANLASDAIALLSETPIYAGDTDILAALISKGLHVQARDMWSKALVANESVEKDDVGALFSLARIYVAIGDLNNARSEVLHIKKEYPKFTVIADQALEEIRTLSQ